MLVLPGHSAPVYSLTHSPDGRLLASCDNECVKLPCPEILWSWQTGGVHYFHLSDP